MKERPSPDTRFFPVPEEESLLFQFLFLRTKRAVQGCPRAVQTWPLKENRNDWEFISPPWRGWAGSGDRTVLLSMLVLLGEMLSQLQAQCRDSFYKHRWLWKGDSVDTGECENRQSLTGELLLVAYASKTITPPSKTSGSQDTLSVIWGIFEIISLPLENAWSLQSHQSRPAISGDMERSTFCVVTNTIKGLQPEPNQSEECPDDVSEE